MIRLIPLKWTIAFVAILLMVPFLLLPYFGETNGLNNFFKSVSIAVLLLGAINSFGLWRWIWALYPTWFNRNICPDLQGTYEGVLISNWNDRTEIPDAKLVIKQSLLYIKIMQRTGESVSFSKIADIVYFDHDLNLFKLFYIYSNEPRNSVRDRSLPHVGAADLTISISKAIGLEGRYFNDPTIRSITGEMRFTRVSKKADFQ